MGEQKPKQSVKQKFKMPAIILAVLGAVILIGAIISVGGIALLFRGKGKNEER